NMRQNTSGHLAEGGVAWQIATVARDINTSKNNLFTTRINQMLDLLDNLGNRNTPIITATVRDTAKSTTMIAAILNLNEGTDTSFKARNKVMSRFFDLHNIIHANARLI